MLELEKIKCEFCEKKMEWIPCSERLPDKFVVPVLITLDNGIIKTANYSELSGKWYVGDEHIVYEMDNVIAWMPLPEPYEGEAHE